MAEPDDADLAAIVCATRVGSVVAAAGCGKTEQIANAVEHGEGRRLILTHTHAGVDALRRRLRDRKVSTTRYAIDTIAGWCLRYSASYPLRSGLTVTEPKGEQDWAAVYAAALQLLASGAIERVLRASYCGVLVDEYQDCSHRQHEIVTAISKVLPTCVFGDPLQAIFDFNSQVPVDWNAAVFPHFPLIRTLTKAHRWHRHGNAALATWLEAIRPALESGSIVALDKRPACVTWEWLPDQDGPRQNKIINACLKAMGNDGNLVVIADSVNEGARAAIARSLGKQRFSTIEPVECKAIFGATRKLATTNGPKRLEATLDLLEKCMSGVGRADFKKAVAARKLGRKLGETRFGTLIGLALALEQDASNASCLALIDGFAGLPACHVYRREMLSAVRSALKLIMSGENVSLAEAVWRVQNQLRHAGRRVPYYSVGSTLLVKGLEFANVVIVHSPNLSNKDWYVALTRATHRITILSSDRSIRPPG